MKRQQLQAQMKQSQEPESPGDEGEQYESIQKKVKSNEERKSDSESSDVNQEKQLKDEDLFKLIEEAEKDENLQFDKDSLHKLINQFGNVINRNQELRQKYAKQPEQFFDSEQEVYNCIKKFICLPSYPELIDQFLESSASQNLILLLTHENNDICIESINFFLEMVKFEFDEGTLTKIFRKLVQQKLIDQLVIVINKLQETAQEEYDAVNNALEILDKMLELDPENAAKLGAQEQFVDWCIARINKQIQGKVIDDNKQYLSEILMVLLADEENAQLFGKNKGIDQILIFLAKYKSKEPQSEEEKETALNFFNCLCELLTVKENVNRFSELQGLELMMILLKKKNFCSANALKVVNYSLLDNQRNCSGVVKLQGLAYIAPVLMRKGIKSKKPDEQQLIDETILSIFRSLIFNCKGLDLQRVVNKFRDNSFEKIDRLVELHTEYNSRMSRIEQKLNEPQTLMALQKDSQQQDLAQLKYNVKLEQGINVLENLDVIIVFLFGWFESDISEKIAKTIQLRQNLLSEINSVIKQYLQFLSGEDSKLKAQISQMLEEFQKLKQ